MDTSPQIEAVLNDLAGHCCSVLNQDGVLNDDLIDQLVLNLSTCGWERHRADSAPLSDQLKDRIKDQCREPAMHRGGMIDGMVDKIQRAYNDKSRYRQSSPKDDGETQAQSPRTIA